MPSAPVEIPKRALYKSAEVCEIAQVQPYVLRSWEKEFPDLGLTRPGGVRVYRRADVERVLRIKDLLFVEGLTLAGARRRLQEDVVSAPSLQEDEGEIGALIGEDARQRIADVRRGLQALLDLLNGNGHALAEVAPPSKPQSAAALKGKKR